MKIEARLEIMKEKVKIHFVLYYAILVYLPVIIGFETECREVRKATPIPCSEEPLKQSPQKAEGEELAQCPHLFPIKLRKIILQIREFRHHLFEHRHRPILYMFIYSSMYVSM